MQMVLGAGSTLASFESSGSCAALLMASASSASTIWNPPAVIGAYQHIRTTSSIADAVHFCEGILCSSAFSSLATASAIVLLPTPDGPRNNQAPELGRLQNA